MRKIILLMVTFSIIFVACSGENEKDLMSSAKTKIQDKLYADALVDFEKIVNNFPETDEAGLAYLEMAKLYQGRAIKTLSEKESYIKAVEYYQVVSNEYSHIEEAPGALFMSGFLLANEIRDLDNAKITYESFLSKYPDHELAASAQSELDNLGLTPEEILERAVAQPK